MREQAYEIDYRGDYTIGADKDSPRPTEIPEGEGPARWQQRESSFPNRVIWTLVPSSAATREQRRQFSARAWARRQEQETKRRAANRREYRNMIDLENHMD